MKAIFVLLLRTHYKNPAWVFGYITSTLFLFIFGGINPDGFTTSVGSVITISLMFGGVFSFGYMLMELRKSVIFKRIGSTTVTKPQAIASMILFSSFVIILEIIYIFLLTAIINLIGYASFNWDAVNWIGTIEGIIVGLLLSISLGFLFVTISGGVEQYNMFSTLYFFLAAFGAGLFFPGSNLEWMNDIGYAVPHSYIANFLGDSFAGGEVFNLNGFEYVIGNPAIIPNLTPELVATNDPTVLAQGLENTFGADKVIITNYTFTPAIGYPTGGYYFFSGTVTAYSVVSQTYSNLQIWMPIGFIIIIIAGGLKLFKWDSK